MELERRALYNLLKMTWMKESDIQVEPWQVEDFRAFSQEELFHQLKQHGITLDRASFVASANDYDTPEELCDDLVSDDVTPEEEDHIYLLIFEAWRRLVPEKQSLSVFCDELDHQINLYDSGDAIHPEDIQDALANLQDLLDDNVDEGADPEAVYASIIPCCANDLESFLYDYIAEQIDTETATYATELLEGFYPYVKDKLWFDFLRARIVGLQDMVAANEMIWEVLESEEELELELYLEILAFLVKGGEKELFAQVVMRASPLIRTEEELQDLFTVCADFYRCLDHDKEERQIQELLIHRSKKNPEEVVESGDPDLQKLVSLVETLLPVE